MYVFGNIDEKGRLQLERKVRDEVGIGANTEVLIEAQGNKITLKPVHRNVDPIKGLFSIVVPGSDKKTLRQMKEEARKEFVDNI